MFRHRRRETINQLGLDRWAGYLLLPLATMPNGVTVCANAGRIGIVRGITL